MNCLSCNNLLITSFKDNIKINQCSKCGGAWLDKVALEKLSYKAGIRPDENKGNASPYSGNTEREDNHGSHTDQ